MASRRLVAPFAYPRREVGPRSVTRIDRHSLILIIGLLTLAAFAGVLYLSQASVAAELRFRLADAGSKSQGLWERNLALRQEIADLKRLPAVEERASRLGMVDASAGDPYVVCAVPKARPALSRPVEPQPQASVDAASSLWSLVARQMGWQPRPEPLAAAQAVRP